MPLNAASALVVDVKITAGLNPDDRRHSPACGQSAQCCVGNCGVSDERSQMENVPAVGRRRRAIAAIETPAIRIGVRGKVVVVDQREVGIANAVRPGVICIDADAAAGATLNGCYKSVVTRRGATIHRVHKAKILTGPLRILQRQPATLIDIRDLRALEYRSRR